MPPVVEQWLNTAPIWTMAILSLGGMLVAAVVGTYLRRRHDKRHGKPTKEEDSQQTFLVSSVMGLLALLIGFTFSMAVDRFDTRRHLVLEEANAIGTTYLRTQLLEEPHRARISKLLSEYTDVRIELATSKPGPAVRPLLQRSDGLIADLWTATVAAFPTMRPYDFSSSYLESMNLLIDTDAARQASRMAHVPSEVFIVLLLYQFMAAGVIGYTLSGEGGRRIAAFLLLLFGIALLLVFDIDHPTAGGIIESQRPMLQVQTFMKERPPASFDRFNEVAGPRTR
ncbi:hypothetical protein GCM10023264_21820 [Sphingomonas daechungensis]|uniref:DUF4239 domain-containing protein n=1 Tax=Sphingomonas daechungensis TaxID=1176646 RepID=A0ABX6T1K9_9SPHN|nr:hypothetical protein [Sphingomonas daechungensis]QNP43729.1 hypothetical protein H9L15_03380 [Sphingomonas daechungensis]